LIHIKFVSDCAHPASWPHILPEFEHTPLALSKTIFLTDGGAKSDKHDTPKPIQYPRLVKALGLPSRLPRMYDTHQMLAMPDMDVLDALGCDVVTVFYGMTNAYQEPGKWHPYDFNGRLPAMVRKLEQFQNLPDGSVSQPEYKIVMQPTSHVFNAEHSGMPLDFAADIPLQDLKKLKQDLESKPLTDADIKDTVEMCKKARESTDKAIFFNGPFIAPIGISAHGGLGVFPVLCLLNPEYVMELHDIHVTNTERNIRALLPEIAPYIDVAISGPGRWLCF
jgi:uroporphyrinogen decarboxylase